MNQYTKIAPALTTETLDGGIPAIGAITMWSVTGATNIRAMRGALSRRGMLEFVDAVNPTTPMSVFHAIVSRYQKRQHESGEFARTIILSPIVKSRRDKASYSVNLAVGQGLTKNDLTQIGSIVFDVETETVTTESMNSAGLTESDIMAREFILTSITSTFEEETGYMSAVDMNLMLNQAMSNLPGATKLIRSRQDWFVPNIAGERNSMATMMSLFDALTEAGTGLTSFNFPVPNLPAYTQQVTAAVSADLLSTLGDLETEFAAKVAEKAGKTKVRAFRTDYIERVFLTCDTLEYRCGIYSPVLSGEFRKGIETRVDTLRKRVEIEISK